MPSNLVSFDTQWFSFSERLINNIPWKTRQICSFFSFNCQAYECVRNYIIFSRKKRWSDMKHSSVFILERARRFFSVSMLLFFSFILSLELKKNEERARERERERRKIIFAFHKKSLPHFGCVSLFACSPHNLALLKRKKKKMFD